MSIVGDIKDWSEAVILPLGWPGLFLMAFAESSFFPIPPDIILALLCLNAVTASGGADPICLFYGAVAAAGSICGAFLGYGMGLKGGRPLLQKFSKEKEGSGRIQAYFDKYGDWAVGVAGFTPIPYKIFTIASGVYRVDLKKFFIASTLSRSARFMGEAVLIMFYGQLMYDFVNDDLRFGAVTGVMTILIVLMLWGKVKAKEKGDKGIQEDAGLISPSSEPKPDDQTPREPSTAPDDGNNLPEPLNGDGIPKE